MGIGPTRPAWKAGILPLNYTRIHRTSPSYWQRLYIIALLQTIVKSFFLYFAKKLKKFFINANFIKITKKNGVVSLLSLKKICYNNMVGISVSIENQILIWTAGRRYRRWWHQARASIPSATNPFVYIWRWTYMHIYWWHRPAHPSKSICLTNDFFEVKLLRLPYLQAVPPDALFRHSCLGPLTTLSVKMHKSWWR